MMIMMMITMILVKVSESEHSESGGEISIGGG